MKKLAILFSVMLLTGCASVSSQERQIVLNRCPILKTYTKDQLQAAAKELKELPSESQLAKMISDYSTLRQACRRATELLKKQKSKNENIQRVS